MVLERGTPRPYHPATAALAIEVAVSSLRRDLGLKALLYGAGGVLEYWVLDIDGRRMVVQRGPHAGGYREREELASGDFVRARSVALPQLDLGALLDAAGR